MQCPTDSALRSAIGQVNSPITLGISLNKRWLTFFDNKVEAAYRRGDALDKRRKMMQDWAEFCAGDTRRLLASAFSDTRSTMLHISKS